MFLTNEQKEIFRRLDKETDNILFCTQRYSGITFCIAEYCKLHRDVIVFTSSIRNYNQIQKLIGHKFFTDHPSLVIIDHPEWFSTQHLDNILKKYYGKVRIVAFASWKPCKVYGFEPIEESVFNQTYHKFMTLGFKN